MTLHRYAVRESMVLALALLAAPLLRADVTVRYQSEFKPSPAVAPFMEAFMKTAQAGSDKTVRMKGNKAYTTVGSVDEVFDFVKQEVILIDPAHKTFAMMPLSQLVDQMAAALTPASSEQLQAARKAMASIQTKVDSKVTGDTAEIQGIQAEERVVTVTLDMPMPAALAKAGPGMNMKLAIHIWTATKAEALRVPALRELTGYQAWQRYVLSPAAMFQKFAGKMPGMSKMLDPIFEELFKDQSVVLRMHMEMYMPFLAAMSKQMAGKGQAGPMIDPDAPLIEVNQEIAELSSAPVDASLFEVPKDYAAVPIEDLVGELVKAQASATPTAPKPVDPK